jgi:hypothetical protein
MSTDIKLGDTSHDLEIVNGDLQLIIEEEEVKQAVKIRLLFWRGEWILDYTIGVAYINGIFDNLKSQEFKDQQIKQAILGTPHIRQLIDYKYGVDSNTQTAAIEFTATTDYGDVVVEIGTT